MSDIEYDYDEPMQQEEWCEAHYQYDCPICNGQDQEGETELENIFYEIKENEFKNPQESLELIDTLKMMAQNSNNRQDWLFKINTYQIPINCRLNNFQTMPQDIVQYSAHIKNAMPNDQNDSFDKILNEILKINDQTKSLQLTQHLLEQMESQGLNALCYKGNIRIAKLKLESNQYEDLKQIIRNLKKQYYITQPLNQNRLIEIYAIEIQLCLKTNDQERLKDIYESVQIVFQTKTMTMNVQDPKNVAVVKDIQGRDKNWQQASNDTWESFLNYQQTGNPQAKKLLKYHVISRILSRNKTNVFYTQEAKAYSNDNDIQQMMQLAQIYENKDIKKFNQFAKQDILFKDDEDLKQYLPYVQKVIQEEKLQIIQKAYTTLKISYISHSLQITYENAIIFLQEMLSKKLIFGRIDYVNGLYLQSVSEDDKQIKIKQTFEIWLQILKFN